MNPCNKDRCFSDAEFAMVSVLVPCYGRPGALKKTLVELQRQSYPNLEIIVLDDCTPGGGIEDIARSFERVKFSKTPTNRGLIAARNYGASLSGGKYLLNLDDDSWPVDTDMICSAVKIMEEHNEIGVLAFNIDDAVYGRRYGLAEGKLIPVIHYTGCGNLYRRSIIETVGPYVEEFYRQGEEMERCMRIADQGYSVILSTDLVVWHDRSPINRDDRKHATFEVANQLRRAILRVPLSLMVLSVARTLLSLARKYGKIDRKLLWNELMHRDRGLVYFLANRKPIRFSTSLSLIRIDLRNRRRPFPPSDLTK